MIRVRDEPFTNKTSNKANYRDRFTLTEEIFLIRCHLKALFYFKSNNALITTQSQVLLNNVDVEANQNVVECRQVCTLGAISESRK